MKKRFIYTGLVFALFFCNITVQALDVTSGAAFVMNAETGDCYYEKNADEPLAPASMTKIMTAYIIYEKMNEGVIAKDTLITADAEDAALSLDPEATNVTLIEGEAYSIDELLGAILVPSACAACEMAGKYLCGSESEFALLMNETAEKLGLTAYYEDASGLSDENRITARSVARLSKIFIEKYPDVLSYTSKPYIIFGGKKYNSTNRMLPGGVNEYPGNDGFKTGTTTLAGYCNTSTAVRDGIRIISVTMHSAYPSARFEDTKKLLDCGFDNAYYLYNNLLASDMHVFINGSEIPSFWYGGPDKGLCFMIEDMKDYGFETEWDEQTRTVTSYRADEKEVTPIPLESYRAYPVGSIMYGIVKSDITAKLLYGGEEYTFKNTYPVGGYTAVSADELINIADACVWNENERRLDIEFR